MIDNLQTSADYNPYNTIFLLGFIGSLFLCGHIYLNDIKRITAINRNRQNHVVIEQLNNEQMLLYMQSIFGLHYDVYMLIIRIGFWSQYCWNIESSLQRNV